MWELFSNAGKPSEIKPITLSERELVVLRYQLRDAGFDLDVASIHAESLREKQFRSLRSGRGEGFTAVMHTNSILAVRRADAVWRRTLQLADEYGGKRIVNRKTDVPGEGTQNRGLMQALADLLSIAALPGEEEEFLGRLNRRIWRGLLIVCESDGEREAVNANFAKYGEIPTAKTASVPLGALGPAWLYLIAIADATSM